MKRFLKNYSLDGTAICVGVGLIAAVLVLFLMVSLVVNAFIGSVAHAEDAFPVTMVVNDTHVRMRAEPSLDSDIVGHKDHGARVQVIGTTGDWALLEDGSYMMLKFLSKTDSVATEEATEGTPVTMVVTGHDVRVRAEANVKSEIVGHKYVGGKAEVVGITDGWAKLKDGSYIFAKYLADEGTIPEPQFSEEIMEQVRKSNDIIVAVLDDQMAYYFRNHKLAYYGPVTTGRNGHKTPTMLTKAGQKRSNFYMNDDPDYYTEYAIFTEEYPDIAFHSAGWEPSSEFGSKTYRVNRGSAGCVRTNDDLMKVLWDNVTVHKTVIMVVQSNH